MLDQSRKKEVNFWVFWDIFANPTWGCIFAAILALCFAIIIAERLLGAHEMSTPLDSFFLVTFFVLQLGQEYKVWKQLNVVQMRGRYDGFCILCCCQHGLQSPMGNGIKVFSGLVFPSWRFHASSVLRDLRGRQQVHFAAFHSVQAQ